METARGLREMCEKWSHDLLNNVIPFWQRYSVDHEYGGYFTHLDVNGGKVFVFIYYDIT